MKKLGISLVLAGLLATLAACGGGHGITMQQIYDAHLTSTVLANHESVSVVQKEDGQVYLTHYVTKDYGYEEGLEWSAFVTDDAFYYYQNGAYTQAVYIDADGPIDLARYRAGLFYNSTLSPTTLQEKVRSVTQAEGKLTVVSELEEKERKALGKGQTEARMEYVLDAATHEPILDKGHYVYEDGTVIDSSAEFAYDAPVPEAVEGFLAVDGQRSDLRTVTFIFEPGTDKEKTLTVHRARGIAVGLMAVTGEMDVYQVYDDAACTQPHVSTGDNTVDTTVYVKWVG